MVMQVHRWDAHGHPHLGDTARPPYGNGVLLWFQRQRLDEAVKRARKHGAEVLEGPKVNPNANHRELWLRDPNGYVVVVAGAYGDLGTPGP